MGNRLIYLPLEPYVERYSVQLSAKDTGWYERNWKKAGVNYLRIEPHMPINRSPEIRTGQVLDAVGRSIWSMRQIEVLLQMAEIGQIKDTDVLFFDDFWTPGVEALKYTFHLMGLKPKMYAYCWAQSVDCYDFTNKMLPWIRHYEKGNGAVYDGVFVTNSILRDMLFEYAIVDRSKIHVVGLPFCSDEVKERMRFSTDVRRKNVVFSSRWDAEKQPEFFCRVMRTVLDEDPEATATVCTSAQYLRSNKPALIDLAYQMEHDYPGRFVVKAGLTKEQYYAELVSSKVQFNCALQDWVSFTLLEASVAGCLPIYPNYRSFPETFCNHDTYLYTAFDHKDAVRYVTIGLNVPDSMFLDPAVHRRSWIHQRMDDTWLRMLQVMDVEVSNLDYESKVRDAQYPYAPFALQHYVKHS